MHWYAPLSREPHAESHVYTGTNTTSIHILIRQAWPSVNSVEVLTVGSPTCKSLQWPHALVHHNPISAVFRTVQCVYWAIGIFTVFKLWLFWRRLVCIPRPTVSREGTKPWVPFLSLWIRGSSLAPVWHTLCYTTRARLLPSIRQPLYRAPCHRGSLQLYFAGRPYRSAPSSDPPFLRCNCYLPRPRARNPLPVISGWSPVYTPRLEHSCSALRSHSSTLVHDKPYNPSWSEYNCSESHIRHLILSRRFGPAVENLNREHFNILTIKCDLCHTKYWNGLLFNAHKVED